MKRLIDRVHAWVHRMDQVMMIIPPGVIEVNENSAAAYQLGYANGVQMGIAQGELKGRTELAIELEAQYGVDAREDLTTEAVKRIRARQVH